MSRKDTQLLNTHKYKLISFIATSKWERLEARGEPPPALQEHSATAHHDKLYVFGGEAGALAETPLWIYDTTVFKILILGKTHL